MLAITLDLPSAYAAQLAPDVIIAWKTGNPQEEDLARLQKYNLNINIIQTPPSQVLLMKSLKLSEDAGRTRQQWCQKISSARKLLHIKI